ncbi:Genome sequencing data, contig C326 (modular protein) [Microcystis aeruginosa PCC 7941]|nr:Genome sequencing data, contig C326 (modular protein) [Microcystis aeruginosa PCC 7941]
MKNRPELTEERLHRTKALMNSNVRDCLVQGYKDLIPSLNLPDANVCQPNRQDQRTAAQCLRHRTIDLAVPLNTLAGGRVQ